MPTIFRALIIALLYFASASGAHAYCSEPDAPSSWSKPRKPEPPIRPYCAATRSCSEWDVNSYNSQLSNYKYELERYKAEVERYVRDLKDYVDEAVEYAQCEVKALEY